MEFWRYYRIIRKRRWLIIIGMIICVCAVQIRNSRSVQQYVGRTTVMESKGMSKEAIPLFPEQFMEMDTQLRLSNLGYIATSQRVLENAARTLQDLDLDITPQEILSHTMIQPVRDTNILAIEVTLPKPQEAKVAADVVAAEFKKVYGELNNAAVQQSRVFIEAQLDTTRQAMVRAQNKLRDFKQSHQIAELQTQTTATIQRLSTAKVDLAQLGAQENGAKASQVRLQEELAKQPDTYVASEQMTRDPTWQQLTSDLAKAESQKMAMTNGLPGQTRRGPNHPEVMALQRQIDDIKNKLAGLSETFKSGVQTSANPIKTNVLDRWVQAKVEAVSTAAKKSAMEQVVESAKAELQTLPEDEAALAELTADVNSATQTYSLMRTKYDEARISEQQAKNEVALRTIDAAFVSPVNTGNTLKLILALVLSPLLGIMVALLLHYTDNTVKTASDAEKLLGLPVQAVVPGARAHSLVRQKCPEIVNVSYQMLTSNLWVANQNHGVNAVAMVSAEPDVGRSVTASNLAYALSKEGARVVLVDADLRQPTQHLIFGVDNKIGLTNLLSGGASIEDVLVPTRVQGLLLVPSGPVPDNPVKLLRSQEMREFCEQIQEAADFVIYDTPAGITFPDPVLVATQVGSAIVVHSAGRVPRGSEQELRARMESVGARLLGVVLNKVKREDSSTFFHYRRSYEGIAVGTLAGGKKALKKGSDS